jgi:anti-anti-sigma factor
VSAESVTTACVEVKQHGSDGTLILRGAFQLDLVRELHEAALQSLEISTSLIVDCAAVEHLDGCALQVLTALKKTVEQTGGTLRMQGASEQVRNYLRWAGLAAQFPENTPMEEPGVATGNGEV